MSQNPSQNDQQEDDQRPNLPPIGSLNNMPPYLHPSGTQNRNGAATPRQMPPFRYGRRSPDISYSDVTSGRRSTSPSLQMHPHYGGWPAQHPANSPAAPPTFHSMSMEYGHAQDTFYMPQHMSNPSTTAGPVPTSTMQPSLAHLPPLSTLAAPPPPPVPSVVPANQSITPTARPVPTPRPVQQRAAPSPPSPGPSAPRRKTSFVGGYVSSDSSVADLGPVVDVPQKKKQRAADDDEDIPLPRDKGKGRAQPDAGNGPPPPATKRGARATKKAPKAKPAKGKAPAKRTSNKTPHNESESDGESTNSDGGAPAQRKRGGRPIGTQNYTPEDVDSLLNYIEGHAPHGGRVWERVSAAFNTAAAKDGRNKRDVRSLKAKFFKLVGHPKPTGDPDIPPEVQRAKLINRQLEEDVEMGQIDSSSAHSGDNSGNSDDGSDAPAPKRQRNANTATPAPSTTTRTRPPTTTPTPRGRAVSGRSSRYQAGELLQQIHTRLDPESLEARRADRDVLQQRRRDDMVDVFRQRDDRAELAALRRENNQLRENLMNARLQSQDLRSQLRMAQMFGTMGSFGGGYGGGSGGAAGGDFGGWRGGDEVAQNGYGMDSEPGPSHRRRRSDDYDDDNNGLNDDDYL